jgi:hypothetical protein
LREEPSHSNRENNSAVKVGHPILSLLNIVILSERSESKNLLFSFECEE